MIDLRGQKIGGGRGEGKDMQAGVWLQEQDGWHAGQMNVCKGREIWVKLFVQSTYFCLSLTKPNLWGTKM